MPTYGYRCRSCGNELEVLQKMSDPPLKTCPKCSGELAKIPYPVGVIYKGSGYYSTDYKGGGKASSSSAAGNGAKSDSSDGSGDSKPATESKSESKAESKASDSSSSE